jgi:prophage regulatory protein
MMTTNTISERFVREPERQIITTISRTQAWKLEKEGKFPQRITVNNRTVVWKLSELLEWINNQPRG